MLIDAHTSLLTVADELLDDRVHRSLEGIEWTAIRHVALEVARVTVLLDGKRVAGLHHLDLFDKGKVEAGKVSKAERTTPI